MEKKKHWLERFQDQTDLPGEAAFGQPIVELAGDRRVLIEHHQGVTQYGCEKICVKVKYGSVMVCGCNLELAQMTKAQLVISGRIDSVTLRRRRKP